MSDPINPKHYKHLPAEAIDIIEAAIAEAPSNESAYLHGQVLKYVLRCWSKKGIEDLRKAKWYLDRLVASLNDLLAEASGADETPSDEPSEDRPPAGWRKMEIGEDIDCNDKFWFCDNWMSYEKDNLPRGKLTGLHVTHIRKIKTPIEPTKRYREPTLENLNTEWLQKMAELESGKCTSVGGLAVDLGLYKAPPPKRYREPTQADLRGGAIECEVRDCDSQAWGKATLHNIYADTTYRFRVRKQNSSSEARYAQCRIEVAE